MSLSHHSISKGATEVIKFGLSIVAAALMSGTAMAADLVIYEPINMADPVVAGNFYASIFGGAAFVHDFDFESDMDDPPVEGVMRFDTGYSVDAALGYDFGNGLSIEGQVGYLTADLSDGSLGTDETDADGPASITYAMLNAWYGVDLGGITPFIGGGVGVASVALDGVFAEIPGSPIDDSEVTWAAQIGAGVSLDVTEDISLVGRYRYMMTGEIGLLDGAGDTNTGSASISIVDVGLKIAF
jgi:opacity protein-like surface antigen